MNTKKEEELILLETFRDKLAPAIFTQRQLDVLKKKLKGEYLTQTEKNYLSNSIRMKLEALALLYNNMNFNAFIEDIYCRRTSFRRSLEQHDKIILDKDKSIETDLRIKRILKKLLKATNIAIITGAGISTSSGLPTYRGKGGYWDKIDPLRYISESGFNKDSGKTIQILSDFKKEIDESKPNIAHKTLAKMENLFDSFSIITQNIDSYHQKAGSSRIFELHGNINSTRTKKGLKIPDIRLFGENINTKEYKYSMNAIMNCDLLLIIGTSGYFDYIKDLIKDCPSYIIEINPEETELSNLCDMHIREKAEMILPRLYNILLRNRLLAEFRKHFESKEIKSMYMYGSILNERRLPNDIDILIIPNKKISDKTLIDIKARVKKIAGCKLDYEVMSLDDIRDNFNEYKRNILFKGILLYGKNVRRGLIG
ncbi:MAG: hypothetical protein KAS15_07970 [Nanoarchaeota archaeon]|nr:hypothetical protein [Nanoarchaeota archaeon]